MVALYVDDILIAAPSETTVGNVKRQLSRIQSMKDLGPASCVLLLQLLSEYSYSTSVGKIVFGEYCSCLGEGMQMPTKFGKPLEFNCGHGSEKLFF